MNIQNKKPYLRCDLDKTAKHDEEYEKKKKIRFFRQLNKYIRHDQILFTGSSLMEHFPVCEFFADLCPGSCKTIYNRGIGGFTSDEFLDNIDTVMIDLKPSKVFINIGTNDMNHDPYTDNDHVISHIISNYKKILAKAEEHLPATQICIMAFYPVNTNVISKIKDRYLHEKFKTRSNKKISEANKALREFTQTNHCIFLDANKGLTDRNGELKAEFTLDGVHMYPEAYRIVFDNICSFI